MTPLTYVYRYVGQCLDIEFNRAPSKTVTEQLHELGFFYDRRYRCWRGTTRRAEALDVCDRAVRQSKAIRVHHETKGQLCWTCANACGGCSWSDGSFTPVPGWTARAIDRSDVMPAKEAGAQVYYRRTYTGYEITNCPQYIPDRRKKKECKTDKAPIEPRLPKYKRFPKKKDLGA